MVLFARRFAFREDAQQLMNDPAAAQERLGLDPLDETCTESYD